VVQGGHLPLVALHGLLRPADEGPHSHQHQRYRHGGVKRVTDLPVSSHKHFESSRMLKRRRSSSSPCRPAGHREYHVQFFGSVAERAWIHEKRIVLYQGKQQYEDLQAETLRKASNPVEKHKVRTDASGRCCQAHPVSSQMSTFSIMIPGVRGSYRTCIENNSFKNYNFL